MLMRLKIQICVPSTVPTPTVQNGVTALHWAVMGFHPEGVRAILAHPGVDRSLRDKVS